MGTQLEALRTPFTAITPGTPPARPSTVSLLSYPKLCLSSTGVNLMARTAVQRCESNLILLSFQLFRLRRRVANIYFTIVAALSLTPFSPVRWVLHKGHVMPDPRGTSLVVRAGPACFL